MSESRTVADRLVDLAGDHWVLGRSDRGESFAVGDDDPGIAKPLRGSRSFRSELAALYREVHGKVPNAAALSDAITVLEGMAQRKDPTPLHLRLAEPRDGQLWLDTGHDDLDRKFIKITREGWRFTSHAPPVLFQRTALTGPMAIPEHDGGDPLLLGDFLNAGDDDLHLLIGAMVAALFPSIPHPVIVFRGPQGTGKSTAERMIVELLDPSPAPLRSAPRDLTDFIVSVSGSWVVALDNISTITHWLSDALCRAVTGDGAVRRALYTDSDLVVDAFRRVILLDGIDLSGLRGDLIDRSLFVDLSPIPPTSRQTDHDLAVRYQAARGRILGGILDLVVEVLGQQHDVRLDRQPRMADFARILAAVDKVTGWQTLEHFEHGVGQTLADAVDADRVAMAIRELIAEHHEWTGTTTDLFDEITPERPPAKWPATPAALGGRLRRAEPSLELVGITVEHRRDGQSRTINIKSTNQPSQLSQPSHSDSDDSNDGESRTPSSTWTADLVDDLLTRNGKPVPW